MNTASTGVSSRRKFLAGAGAIAALPLNRAIAQALPASRPHRLGQKLLIIFSLVGGNDGLNTLAPFSDPLYRRFRPTIGLPAESLLRLDDEFALHPHLKQTMAMFQSGELAVIPDVGYPHPNLSHFESAAIWDSAKPALGMMASSGWWGDVVTSNRAAFDAAQLDTAAISFEHEAAFAAGDAVSTWRAQQDVRDVLGTLPDLNVPVMARRGLARELAAMIQLGLDTRSHFVRRLQGARAPEWNPYEEPIDVQLRLTDWFLRNGVRTPLIRLVQGGFDTHSELRNRHDALMTTVDYALGKLRDSLKSQGRWNDTIIMVHSEFGRRPVENGFGGADHGAAGPILLAGGGLRGGIHGTRARLDDLDHDGNPRFTTDFRRVYASLTSGLFELATDPFKASGFAPLPDVIV